MGKKKAKEVDTDSNTQYRNIPNKEAFQKMNFLYQASYLAMNTGENNIGLARFYIDTALGVRKRVVLKLNADMKKTFCKRCHIPLIPGKSAKFRLKSKTVQHLVVTCLACKCVKSFRTDRLNINDMVDEGNKDTTEHSKELSLLD